MRKFLLAAMVLLIPVLSVSVTDAEESTTTMYLRADQLQQTGDYDGAIALYKKILLREDSPTVMLKMYEVELRRGNRPAASKILRDAHDKHPNHAQIAFMYGIERSEEAAKYEKGSSEYIALYKEANKAFQSAVKNEPIEQYYLAAAVSAAEIGDYDLAEATYQDLIDDLNRPEYYRSIAVMKLQQGKRQEAVAALEKAIKFTDDIQSYLIIADIYMEDGNVEEALKYLQAVSDIEPGLVMPHLYIGEYYKGKKDYDNAVHEYMQAVENMDDPLLQATVLKQVGGMALEKEDYVLAYEAFSRGIALQPDDQQVYYYAGYAAEMLDDPGAARAMYKKGIERFPDYSMLKKRLAVNYLLGDEPEMAIKTANTIDEIERDVEYYMIVANSYEALGDIPAAIKALEDGVAEYTYNTNLFISLATLYEQTGRENDCIELLKTALKYEPDSATLKNFLGYIYADMNINLDEAYRLITEALAQEPDNYAYIDSLAWVHFRKGNYEEAYELIMKAFEMRPEDEEIIDHMSQIQEALKK